MSAWPDEHLCMYCGHATEQGTEVCGNCTASIVGAQYGGTPGPPQLRSGPPATDEPHRPRRGRRPTPVRPGPLRPPRAPRQRAICGDVCPGQAYYTCTLPPGHVREHTAHGEPYTVLASWPRDSL